MVQTNEYQNRKGERFRVAYDIRLHEWYAFEVDQPYSCTRSYLNLSDAIHAADLSLWEPIRDVVENRR